MAPDPRQSTGKYTGAGVVGLFSGSLCGLELVPSNCRCLVPPTSPLRGCYATGIKIIRDGPQAVGQKERVGTNE